MKEQRHTTQAKASVRVRRRDGEAPVIEGYAAVYYDGTPDTEYELWAGVRERIMPGAFRRVVGTEGDADHSANYDGVVALFNHSPDHVLGRGSAGTLRLTGDTVGLKYSITPPDTTTGRDVVELISRGDLTGSSFAFVVTDEEWKREDGEDIREIKGVDLYDVGPVTFPAYEATTTNLRSQDGVRESYRQWKASQRDAGLRERTLAARIDAAKLALDT